MKPRLAVRGVLLHENRLLLVNAWADPSSTLWCAPGGGVELGQSLPDNLKREVMEETGLEVANARYLMSHPNDYNYRGMVAPVIDLFYVCDVDANVKIELEPSELEHYEWVRPTEEYLDDMAFPSNRLAVEYWLSHQD